MSFSTAFAAREAAKQHKRKAKQLSERLAIPPEKNLDNRIGDDMETAEEMMQRAQLYIPCGAAITGRKERNKPSCPQWVDVKASAKQVTTEKKRGRPALPPPHPDFYEAFPAECYAEGTLNNKKSHIRAAIKFVEYMRLGKKLEDLSVAEWRLWGIKMATSGIDWTVLSFYLGTVRAFLGWKKKWNLYEMNYQAVMAWEQVKKASIRFKPSQAPVILREVYRRLPWETKRTVLFAVALGLRHGSLMSIRPENIMKVKGGWKVHISEFKWLPEGRGRVGYIYCACTPLYNELNEAEGIKLKENDTCLVCNPKLGLPSFPIDETKYMTMLRAHNLWGHSARVTAATMVAAMAAQFNIKPSMRNVYHGFGWTLPKERAGKKNKYAMYCKYSVQAGDYSLSQLMPAFGHIANLVGLEEEDDRVLSELESGPEDIEEYEDEKTGRVVRIGALAEEEKKDLETNIDHSLDAMEKEDLEGESADEGESSVSDLDQKEELTGGKVAKKAKKARKA